ncbi:MAG: hypothetical protein K6C09_08335 [Oscillospiraceae bacterium]|nr:hypothetical protein [Oscillospiraceae bacterium]
MTEEKRTDRRGLSFVSLLTIAFIVLKLCGVIDWRWGWVLSPLWISLAAGLLILITAVAVKRK